MSMPKHRPYWHLNVFCCALCNHPSTLAGMNNLAVVLVREGKYPEVEQIRKMRRKAEEDTLSSE